jgi:hypothetical protein
MHPIKDVRRYGKEWRRSEAVTEKEWRGKRGEGVEGKERRLGKEKAGECKGV